MRRMNRRTLDGWPWRYPTQRSLIVGFHSAVVRQGATSSLRNRIYRSRGYARLLKRARTVHVLNPGDASAIPALKGLEVAVIPNGVDTNKFHDTGRTTWGSSRSTRVLFAGRLDLQKGVDTFCEVVEIVNSGGGSASVTFTVADDGPMRNLVRHTAGKWSNVSWRGNEADMGASTMAMTCWLPFSVGDVFPGPRRSLELWPARHT